MNPEVKACARIVLTLSLLVCGLAQGNESDLVWSTFLGGCNGEYGFDVAIDSTGNVYITGSTMSYDFPTTAGAFDTTFNGTTPYTAFGDVFVVKLNAMGSAITYSTFLGGNGSDLGTGIAVDNVGNAYVTGSTWSSNFPTTTGAFDTSYSLPEAFVTKLDALGNVLIYSTYLGGSDFDVGWKLAIDKSGKAYVIGSTQSNDFPTTDGAFDTTCIGSQDAFVVKLNETGNDLEYASFLGGSDWENGLGIAVDDFHNVYVTGYTASDDFPTTAGAFNTTHNGGNPHYDVFVAKIDPTGTSLVYSTFLGGGSPDYGYDIALDDSCYVYVTGYTTTGDFPTTTGAFDRSYNGLRDGFLVKFNQQGSALDYATFLGGDSDDYAHGISVDNYGNLYVTGFTNSDAFPTTTGAFDETYNGDFDAFIAKLNDTGTTLSYATYLGGGLNDYGQGITLDNSGQVHVVGETWSSDFSTSIGAFDTSLIGDSSDVFVAKFDLSGYPVPVVSEIAVAGLPKTCVLHQNYPNAFNPETWISYQLPEAGLVTIRIYNVTGQLVKTLVDEEQAPGLYRVCWSGRDLHGIPVGSGVYFCKMKAGAFDKGIKMVLVR